jgi:ribosomal protein L37E
MQKYDRAGTSSIDNVIALIRANMDKPNDKTRVLVAGQQVKVTSLRLRTFALKGTTCSCCGLQASFFAVERDMGKVARGEQFYHLNLWGIDENGDEMLFTHDHTLAQALGGKNDLSNTTTMCIRCNHEKGILEQIK